MLDGKTKLNVAIERMTTIPMPHRGQKALLRTHKKTIKTAASLKVAKSKYANMTAMDLLKWGLQYKRNVKNGGLKDLLISEGIIEDTKAAVQKQFWKDFKAQVTFMQGMQACFGEEFDPRLSKPMRDSNGKWETNKNDVPQNVITVRYLLHAYDVRYSTFKRMKKSDAFISVTTVHKNRGKSVLDDKVFAAQIYSPFRMYSMLKFAQWQDTEDGCNADKERKKVH